MKIYSYVFVFITCLLLMSCGEKEAIDPAFESKSFTSAMEESQNKDGFLITYRFGSFEVDRIGDGVGKVPIIGGLLQSLTESFADIVITADGGREYKIEPSVFAFPELDDIDFTMVNEISIESVNLRASKKGKKSNVDLSFIDEIDVKLIGSAHSDKFLSDKKTGDTSNVVYLKRVGGSYRGAEINLKPSRDNLKELIKRYRKFKVVTDLKLGAVPKEDMVLAGKVRFRIKVDPGF